MLKISMFCTSAKISHFYSFYLYSHFSWSCHSVLLATDVLATLNTCAGAILSLLIETITVNESLPKTFSKMPFLDVSINFDPRFNLNLTFTSTLLAIICRRRRGVTTTRILFNSSLRFRNFVQNTEFFEFFSLSLIY